MLSPLLAHQGDLQGFHDLWWFWNTDPLVLIGLATAGSTYIFGSSRRRRRPGSWRARSFWLGLTALAVALVSPLDALAGQLASAHMVQHVLLVLVAAPLLAYSSPIPTMLIGMPRSARRNAGRARRLARLAVDSRHWLRSPGMAWLAHAATVWFWHASVPYEAALQQPIVHAIEHIMFLITGMMFWAPVLSAHRSSVMPLGYGALFVFTMAMQSVFLSALLTFATTAWYDTYRVTAPNWGLAPLADQQLAGAIMWVPAGLIYVAVGVMLVVRWVAETAAEPNGDRISDFEPRSQRAHHHG